MLDFLNVLVTNEFDIVFFANSSCKGRHCFFLASLLGTNHSLFANIHVIVSFVMKFDINVRRKIS